MLKSVWIRLTALLAAIANWRYFKPAVFVGCLVPGLALGWETWEVLSGENPGALGTDPKTTLLHETGEFALGILFATLAVTPVRRIFKINRVQIVRRMLGVFSFFYAVIHFGIYLGLDQACYSPETCDVAAIVNDLGARPFIFMGMISFVCMLLLALTSTSGAVRLLKKKWQTLHRLVYVAAIAGVIHFIWIQKSDFEEPLNWAFWLAVLLGIRVYFSIQKRRAAALATVKR